MHMPLRVGWDHPRRRCFLSAITVVFLVELAQGVRTPWPDREVPGKEPAYRPDTCLIGDKHKTKPSPEGIPTATAITITHIATIIEWLSSVV